MGDNSALARLQFQLNERPVVDRPLTLRYRVLPIGPVQSVQVTFDAEPGLTLVDELRAAITLDATAVASTPVHELPLLPSAEGVKLLKATVVTQTAQGVSATEFGIPLLVGAGEPAAAPAAAASPGG